jgi:hypothetical protein
MKLHATKSERLILSDRCWIRRVSRRTARSPVSAPSGCCSRGTRERLSLLEYVARRLRMRSAVVACAISGASSAAGGDKVITILPPTPQQMIAPACKVEVCLKSIVGSRPRQTFHHNATDGQSWMARGDRLTLTAAHTVMGIPIGSFPRSPARIQHPAQTAQHATVSETSCVESNFAAFGTKCSRSFTDSIRTRRLSLQLMHANPQAVGHSHCQSPHPRSVLRGGAS